MHKKVKNIISKVDLQLFKFFGTDKGIKSLENIKEAQIIFSYLNNNENENAVRFVGGCVRKALCGEKIDDIDFATSHKPEEVKNILSSNGIEVFDTGLSHGTVTAVVNQKKFEITTLREDVLPDGRHANVKFTTNWELDASRRDFTINAIYVDVYGRIFDPLNGVSDLKNGIIKFIGLPEERIQEDYLRILRYFRFFSQYSKSNHDQDTIKSIKRNINGISKISNERILSEIKKILSVDKFYKLFSETQSREIILNIFPQFKYFKRLTRLNKLEKKLTEKYDDDLIIALLLVDETNNYDYFCYKYKTSNLFRDRLKNISKNFISLKSKKFFTENNLKKMVYLSNKKNVLDLLLFLICENNKIEISKVEQLINYVSSYKIPKFPISGDYL